MALKLSFLQQLSVRERRLLGLVLFTLVLAGTFVFYIRLLGQIEDVEFELVDGQQAVETIHARSREYRDSLRRKAALETAIQANDQRIQTALDSMARRIELTGTPDGRPAQGTLNTVLRYDAKTTERPLLLGASEKTPRSGQGRSSSRSQTRASEYLELVQPFEYSFVNFSDLLRFLDEVESPGRLMYVSRIQATRKYMEPDYVQGRLSVATFIHRPQADRGTAQD